MFYRLSRLLFGCSLMLWIVSPAMVSPVTAQGTERTEEGIDIFADAEEDTEEVDDSSDIFDLVDDSDDSVDSTAADASVTDEETTTDEELFTGDDTFSMEDVQPDAISEDVFGDADAVDDGTGVPEDASDDFWTDDSTEVDTEDAATTDAAADGVNESQVSPDALQFEPVDEVPAPVTIRSAPITPWRGAQRRNAPGVVKEVTGDAEPKDAVTRYDLTLPELVGQNGDSSWMKDVPLRRELWVLEFRFKPVGIIDVDIPQPSGKVQKRKIWYLVYSVKNTGNVVVPKQGKDKMYSLEPSAKSVRFFPRFIFESTNTNKLYRDQILPIAVDAIQRREGTKFQLLNTVEAVREIAPGEEISGVVTWDTIDPMTNKFSIYVQGLTNAYIWKQATQANGGVELTEGKTYRKTLKINFLRRGDQYLIREDQILYGVSGGLDWQWVYR